MLETNKIYCGDCLEVMKDIDDNSIDLVLTDPPYGLKFMGKKWDCNVPSVEVWKECLRVLKPGGYLLSFGGTRTYHRLVVNIEDAGFEIRDMIAWVYGSGFPKSLNIGKAVDKLQGNEREVVGVSDNDRPNSQVKGGRAFDKAFNEGQGHETINITKGTSEWEGWGTALKPAHEPIVMARKPLSEKSVALNVLKWGTGGINIDGCRIGTSGGGQNGSGGSKDRTRYRMSAIPKSDEVIGRFPANLIHDGSDEVVGLFPQTSPSKAGGKSGTTFASGGSRTDPRIGHNDNGGSASRFFYCAKASRSERNAGLEDMKNNHPTVKPISLLKYLLKMASKEGDAVLDPFVGSGTTAVACKQLNRNYIGIEISPEYCEIANSRLDKVVVQPKVKDWF